MLFTLDLKHVDYSNIYCDFEHWNCTRFEMGNETEKQKAEK